MSAPGDAVCPGPPHRHPCVRVHAACPGPRRVCPPPGACVRVHVASVRPPGDAVRRCRVSGSALSGSASAVCPRLSASTPCPRLSASVRVVRPPRRVSASVRVASSTPCVRVCPPRVCPPLRLASASVLSARPPLRLSCPLRPACPRVSAPASPPPVPLRPACPRVSAPAVRLSACVRPRRVRPRRRVSAPAAVSRFAPPVRVCPPPPPCVRPRRRV